MVRVVWMVLVSIVSFHVSVVRNQRKEIGIRKSECGSGNELEWGSGNGEGGKSGDGGQKLEVGMRKWELMD
jgi:hypothetical protein